LVVRVLLRAGLRQRDGQQKDRERDKMFHACKVTEGRAFCNAGGFLIRT
jgi:hypothetical protein